MRGRLRYLLALAFLSLLWIAPEPDAASGKPYIAWMQVRAWLLGDSSPLATHVGDEALPPLVVDLAQSPPLVDPQLRTRRVEEFGRIAEEWAAAHGLRIDPARPPIPLVVRIGELGVRATLPAGAGPPPTFEARFPDRTSLLPACLTIAVALLFLRVLPALLLGGLCGAIAFVWPGTPSGPAGVFDAVLEGSRHFALDALFRRSLCDDFNLLITVFVAQLFLTVAVISRNGGVHGTVEWLKRRVRTARGAQLITWLTGLLVFFDDYTNCMVTGSAMRPLCDSRGVSRAKLAYIVDSTAAPVAGVSLFSSWIVYEISMFRAPLALVTAPDGSLYRSADAYDVFLATLPFRFYCFLALLLVFLVAVLGRDFGPMLAAERSARRCEPAPGNQLRGPADEEAPTDVPHRALNGTLPILVLLVGAAVPILGYGVRTDRALVYASSASLLTALALTFGQRLLPVRPVVEACGRALRGLFVPFCVLFLAWTLGHISDDLGTSHFLCAIARDAMVAAALPLTLFVLAGLIAFATGTSFTTMAILLPNVVVLAHQLGTETRFLGDPAHGGPALMMLSIGAVLEGAIFGDHCSPISDTTVLSSLASRCDHLTHVATQLPYALLTAAVALGFGYLPMVLLGPSWWPLAYLGAAAFFLLFLRLVGRPCRAASGESGT